MTVPLDPNIKALMNVSVTWEQYTGQDMHADPTYAAPKTKLAWVEERGVGGGVEGFRRAEDTVFDPRVDIYFDASDADVQAMSMRDRFTVSGEINVSVKAEPDRMLTFYGPTGAAWVKLVTL